MHFIELPGPEHDSQGATYLIRADRVEYLTPIKDHPGSTVYFSDGHTTRCVMTSLPIERVLAILRGDHA